MKRILIAAGGTGGHVIPAQALASELLQEGFYVLFAGHSLSTNRYFDRERFKFQDVSSSTLSLANLKGVLKILRGIKESLKLLETFSPDLVVGFGSFHSFPVLAASVIKRKKIALFEPNAIPGKVNRLFSPFAKLSAVQFPSSCKMLKGNVVGVTPPTPHKRDNSLSPEEARRRLGLKEDLFTFLVFGGSQGAIAINHAFYEVVQGLKKPCQAIHITGSEGEALLAKELYAKLGFPARVCVFDKEMSLLFSAADLAICRSGALTIAELIEFHLPAILVPFPRAADDHQTANARFLENDVGSGVLCSESSETGKRLCEIVASLQSGGKLNNMRERIKGYKQQKSSSSLAAKIKAIL